MSEDLVVSFKCPGCGLTVIVEASPKAVFIHPMPTCARFDRCNTTADMVDIIREARIREEAEVS